MLVVTRKEGQVICIGPDIEVEVVRIKGGQVRIGVRAPADVRVDRKEVRIARDAKPGDDVA